MAYTYTTFGSITLPVYNRESDLSPVTAMTRFVQTANGAFDADGSGRSLRRYPHPLTIDAIVSESTAAAQRTAIDALRVATGTRATMTRKADSDAAEHTATCRLVGMTQMRSYGERGYQPVRLQFAQLTPWRAKTLTTVTATLEVGDLTKTFTVANAGTLPVTNVTLVADYGESAQSLKDPQWTATGIDLKISGTVILLSATVDCGALSAIYETTVGNIDRYANLVLGAAHTIDAWMRFQPGNTSLTFTRATSAGDPELALSVSFYAEYA
jgi:hypothetical protein